MRFWRFWTWRERREGEDKNVVPDFFGVVDRVPETGMGDSEQKSSGGHGGGQGGDRGQGGGQQKKKESILDLSKYLDKTVGIKFQGGREATGILKGYDNLLNVVLDNTR